MPSTLWHHDEFSLHTTADGTDTGIVGVALDITYHRDGQWKVDTAGFITGWDRSFTKYPQPIVEWLPEGDLDRLIVERAEKYYSDEIDEHVGQCVYEDHGERMWG